MLKLNSYEIAVFKQLQAYIDEKFIPPRYWEMYGNCRCIFDLFDNKYWEKEEKKVYKFCTQVLAYFNNDHEKLYDCCRKACISNATYSKICEKTLFPSKECLCKIAIAARMNYDYALQLFEIVNLDFYEYCKFDVAMMFFLENGIFDLCTINKLLCLLDLPMLSFAFL